jgi:hypothetical protein
MIDTPKITSQKISGARKANRTLSTKGNKHKSTRNPKRVPQKQTILDIAKARVPSPFRVKGNPSRQVAAFGPVPGVFSNIAGRDPPKGETLIIPA